MQLIKQLDRNLLTIAWSLWTELGVAGVIQNHQNELILLEELVLFTSCLSEVDPRLRDESIDWLAKYHHYISLSRLKFLLKEFPLTSKAFARYAASLNAVSKANWPLLEDASPIRIRLSQKSILRHLTPALLNIRARSLFGVGARADLVTFFLVHPNIDFSIAELAETGYSKRNLAEILGDLHLGRLLERSLQGNRLLYRLNKNNPLFLMLKPIPESTTPWHLVYNVLLTLRACILQIDNYSESTKVVELSNCLKNQENTLQKLGLTPPLFQNNFSAYLENFSQWILQWTDLLAKGQFNP